MASFHYYTLLDGSYVTGGGGTPADATVVTTPGVTYPTAGSVALDGFFPGVDRPHLWFKFTAADSADVLIDTDLTFLQGTFDHEVGTDKPYTALGVYVPNTGVTSPATLSDLHAASYLLTFADRKRLVLHAVAGVTYWIRVGNNGPGDGSAYFVIEVSGYGTTTDWIDLGDQQWVVVPPDLATTSNDRPTPGAIGGTEQPNHIPDVIPWNHAGHIGLGYEAKWDRGFHGQYNILQGFFGGDPTTDSAAWACSWKWGRRAFYPGQFWTDTGTGSGTGAGVCSIFSGSTNATEAGGSTVSVNYNSSASAPFLPAQVSSVSVAPVSRLNLTTIRDQAGPNAGLAFPTPPTGYETADLIWEEETCTITGLDIAPDELLLADRSGPAAASDATLAVQWYVQATLADESGPGIWGPDRVNDRFVGTELGPESLIYDYASGTYTGGLASWEALPSGIIANALTYEGLGAEYGVRAVALSPEQMSDSLPVAPTGTAPESITRARILQVPSYRVHLSPSRLKWALPPVMPPVIIAGGFLRIQPRDDAKNASTALRQFPPEKQSIRVHGGYPGGPGA